MIEGFNVIVESGSNAIKTLERWHFFSSRPFPIYDVCLLHHCCEFDELYASLNVAHWDGETYITFGK